MYLRVWITLRGMRTGNRLTFNIDNIECVEEGEQDNQKTVGIHLKSGATYGVKESYEEVLEKLK